jgi:hypothetical protein
MKPITRRTFVKLILLASCIFLSSCCGLCTKCPEGAECTIIPSNAAAGIKSTAGRFAPTADSHEPNPQDATLPEGWRATYPMFEGDYFTVTLPAAVPESSTADRPGPPALSLNPPAEVSETTGSPVGLVTIANNPAAVAEITDTVRTIVSHMGFANPTGGDVLTTEFFDVEPHVMSSGGGDILKVAQINCETGPQTDPDYSTSFCSMNEDQQRQLIERAAGIAVVDYLDRRVTRYFYYQRPQYREWPTDPESSEKLCVPDPASPGKCIDVFIEHVVIAATTRPNGTVTSVSGRVFPSYKVTNEPKLTAAEAVAAAYEHLWKIEEISRYEHPPPTKQKLPLVLLPYAHTARFDLSRIGSLQWPSYRTPQLRYAYRTTLWGNYVDEVGRRVEAASWRAWVDAETGDILQLIPQFAFSEGVEAKGKGWPLHPNYPVSEEECLDSWPYDCPTERTFEVDIPDSGVEDCQCPEDVDWSRPQYCLKLANVFSQVKYFDGVEDEQGRKKFCTTTVEFAEGLDCETAWDCLCPNNDDLNNVDLTPVNYLLMNAYAHVYAYKQKLDGAICSSADGAPLNIPPICVEGAFQVAKNKGSDAYVPLRVQVGGDSLGFYEAETDSPHLTFGEIDEIFSLPNLCASENHQEAGKRPGAQDATLMTHEFAHIVMDGLHTSRPDNWCGQEACPVPLSSDIVHDMADGLSAVSNQINWFGAWRGNDTPEDSHSEWDGHIRKFDYAFDHFPEHRRYIEDNLTNNQITFYLKGYADGQIAASALWAVTESMNRWAEGLGPAAFEIALLNVLPNHFIPNACPAFEQGDVCDYPNDCDIDVYRYLHFLLADLIANDITTGVTVTTNKYTAGFAKAGIFLVPPRCIGASTGADPADGEDAYCLSGSYGGDAVIDIRDDWLNHGTNLTDPEVPIFDVWTGPQFRFQDDHAIVVKPLETPPCNKFYKISIANNAEFENDATNNNLSKDTVWLEAGEDCRAHWSPAINVDTEWMPFWESIAQTSRNDGGSKTYYRVVTGNSDAADALWLSSSEYPGKPQLNDAPDQRVGPPHAVLNGTGEQEP